MSLSISEILKPFKKTRSRDKTLLLVYQTVHEIVKKEKLSTEKIISGINYDANISPATNDAGDVPLSCHFKD